MFNSFNLGVCDVDNPNPYKTCAVRLVSHSRNKIRNAENGFQSETIIWARKSYMTQSLPENFGAIDFLD